MTQDSLASNGMEGTEGMDKKTNRVLFAEMLKGGEGVGEEEKTDGVLRVNGHRLDADRKVDADADKDMDTDKKVDSDTLPVNPFSLFLDGSEGYFDQHKSRDRMSTTPFTRAADASWTQLNDALDAYERANYAHLQELSNTHTALYGQYAFELSQGFNLLFYGLGSKRELLMDVARKCVPSDVPVVLANGFKAATTHKELLNMAAHVFLDGQRATRPRHPPDLLAYLINRLSRSQDKRVGLVFVIHSLDGAAFRNEKSQDFLSQLAACAQIQLVASVDHVLAATMWDSAKHALYNFLWHHTPTLRPYRQELAAENLFALGRDRSAVGSRGIRFVLSSVTCNARALYRLLVCHVIEQLAETGCDAAASAKHALDLQVLYQQCAREFVASNDANFRTMLAEFTEHKMATIVRKGGREHVYIPFTRAVLQEVLDDFLS